MAGSTVAVGPTLILFFSLQPCIVRGVKMTGLKC